MGSSQINGQSSNLEAVSLTTALGYSNLAGEPVELSSVHYKSNLAHVIHSTLDQCFSYHGVMKRNCVNIKPHLQLIK